jgi:hypothetical protein
MKLPDLALPTLLLCCCGFFLNASRSAAETIEWHSSYQVALEQAKELQKPLFLEFRCGP